MRKPTHKSTDRRVFRNTADKTKALNVRPILMRGGFRL